MPEFIREYLPIIIVVAIIGAFTIAFLMAWLALKRHKEDIYDDRERKISDGRLILRLLHYAKPHWKSFVAVFFIMLFSIVHEIVSPLLMGSLTDLVKEEFTLQQLFTLVGLYAGILIVSLICTYFQALILQRVGPNPYGHLHPHRKAEPQPAEQHSCG